MSSARRVCVVVVPALLGAVLALPAVASPEVAPVTAGATAAALLRGADGPGSPAVRVEGPAGPARGVVDALTAVRRHADTGAWLRSTAAAVQAAQGPIGGLRPLLLEPEADVEPVESEPLIDDFAVADRGGDLDGDGLEDVLAFTADAEDDVLQARRGTDGGLLWSIALSEDAGALAFPVGRDLTGDGVDDLLLQYMVLLTEDWDETETPEGFSYHYTATFQHVYGVRSGVDGSQAWEHRVDGSIDEAFEFGTGPGGVQYDGEYRLRSTARDVLPLISDDATGDGIADLAVSEVDLDVDDEWSGAGLLVAGAGTATATLRSDTRAAVLDGRTGAPGLLRTATDQSGVSLLIPVGQVVGTPVADLAWTTDTVQDIDRTCVGTLVGGECLDDSTGREGVEVELVDGQTGEPAWAMTTTGFAGFAFPLGTDADADGTADLGLEVRYPQGRLLAVSGDDGKQLWEAPGVSFPPMVLGFAPDDAGPVVVLGDWSIEETYDLSDPLAPWLLRVEAVAERRAAATGELLSTSRRDAAVKAPAYVEGGAMVAFGVGLDSARDGDGDGTEELVLSAAIEVTSFDEDGEVVEQEARSTIGVEQLGTGRVLLSETSDDFRGVHALGDVDGDGLLDLRRDQLTFGRQFDIATESTAFRLVDGATLWQFSGDLSDAPLLAGDQDGQPGDELVTVRGAGAGAGAGAGDDAGDAAVVASLRGQDLAERWRAAVRAAPRRSVPIVG